MIPTQTFLFSQNISPLSRRLFCFILSWEILKNMFYYYYLFEFLFFSAKAAEMHSKWISGGYSSLWVVCAVFSVDMRWLAGLESPVCGLLISAGPTFYTMSRLLFFTFSPRSVYWGREVVFYSPTTLRSSPVVSMTALFNWFVVSEISGSCYLL